MKLESHMLKYNNQSTHSLAESASTMNTSPYLLHMPTLNTENLSLPPVSRSINCTATYDPAAYSAPASANRMNEFMSFRPPSQNMGSRSETWQLSGDELMNSDKSGQNSSGSSVRYMDFDMHDHVPSLEEIRAHAAQVSSPPAATLPPDPIPDKSEDLPRIMAELGSLWSTLSTTQAEIAGISSIMAEYLAYMRKPLMAAAGYAGNGHNQALLGTLEKRAREIREMAATKHMEAWSQLYERLGAVESIGEQLQQLMASSESRAHETAHFFRSSYDIRVALDEQVGLPHHDSSRDSSEQR